MLSPEETARYSRHLRLPGFQPEEQVRLRQARVLIIGLGGLGSPAALYLAAAGVGTLGLADFDLVEQHNLQRQVLHGEDGVNQPKLTSAAERLRALRGDMELTLHPEGITCENARAVFGQYDVIVDGTDNFPTRYLNNDAAYFTGKPLVYGSVFQYEGQVSVFHPAQGGPCYRCLFPEMPAPGTVPNCDEAGVLGALCGVIGSYQAMEAIKLLTGLGEPLGGRLLVINALNMAHRSLRLKPDPDCPLCGRQPAITALQPGQYQFSCEPEIPQANMASHTLPTEIDVHQAKARLDSEPGTVLLDVREGFEVAICAIPGARHIPLKQLGERLSELPSDRPLLVYCHHGMRSLHATHALRARGFNHAQSIMGGIEAWAQTHDPAMQRY